MAKPTSTRFSVTPENAEAAIAHVTARGFPPIGIERAKVGLVHLLFAPLPDEEMYGLVQALPVHLSARIGITAANSEDFERLTRTLKQSD